MTLSLPETKTISKTVLSTSADVAVSMANADAHGCSVNCSGYKGGKGEAATVILLWRCSKMCALRNKSCNVRKT